MASTEQDILYPHNSTNLTELPPLSIKRIATKFTVHTVNGQLTCKSVIYSFTT